MYLNMSEMPITGIYYNHLENIQHYLYYYLFPAFIKVIILYYAFNYFM